MKTKLAILILALCSSAQASLIEVTPGGFNSNNAPPVLFELLHRQQIAGANVFGSNVVWSPFEPLGANNFSFNTNGMDGTITWNLPGTGYEFSWLLLEGNGRDNIYRNAGGQIGTAFVTIDEFTDIEAIIFYRNAFIVPAADSGTTLLLFVLAIAILFISWSVFERWWINDTVRRAHRKLEV